MMKQEMMKQAFRNIDIDKALIAIVDAHTEYYKTDLDYDLDILREAAESGETNQDRTFYWLCRPCGTWCLKERNVFLKGTQDHSTWLYYAEQESSGILAYAIELDRQEEGSDNLTGSLYELDYPAMQEAVLRYAVPVSKTLLVYENKEIVREPNSSFRVEVGNEELGKFVRFEAVPEDPSALELVLLKQREGREMAKEGDLGRYLGTLEKGADRP